MATSDPTTLTDEELSAHLIADYAETKRRALIAGYAASQEAAQEAMQEAITSNTASATPFSAATVYQPGSAVSSDGHVYWWPGPGTLVNDAPATSTHWIQLPDPGAQTVPWTTGMSLTTGLLVTNGGHTYKWAGADTTNAPSNYAPTGTTSTASWTFIS